MTRSIKIDLDTQKGRGLGREPWMTSSAMADETYRVRWPFCRTPEEEAIDKPTEPAASCSPNSLKS